MPDQKKSKITFPEFVERVSGAKLPNWQKDFLSCLESRLKSDTKTIIIQSRLRDPGKSFFKQVVLPKQKPAEANMIIIDDPFNKS